MAFVKQRFRSSHHKYKRKGPKALSWTDCVPWRSNYLVILPHHRFTPYAHLTPGKCVRVNYDFFRLVRRLHVIYFRSSDHPTGTLLLPAILTRFKKRTYADYTPKRNKCIWSSREELLEYEQALELRMVLDEAVNPTPPKSRWGRKKTKTPAPVKQEKFVTPIPGRPETTPLKTPRSCASVRFADDVKQEDEEVVAGDVEEEAHEELIITEDEKVLRARAVKKYYEDWLKDRWYGYLAVKQEPGLQPRVPALERFEPGTNLFNTFVPV